jgi:hypothetical protein
MIMLFIIVHPLELISAFVLTFNVKSILLPGVGVGVDGLGVPVSLLPQAPRHELITRDPALRPNAARKSLRSILIFVL